MQMVDGGWGVIRGGTIEPLLRTVERLFNTGALDTVAITEQKLQGKEGRSGGRQKDKMEQKMNNCICRRSRRWRRDEINVEENKRAVKTEERCRWAEE